MRTARSKSSGEPELRRSDGLREGHGPHLGVAVPDQDGRPPTVDAPAVRQGGRGGRGGVGEVMEENPFKLPARRQIPTKHVATIPVVAASIGAVFGTLCAFDLSLQAEQYTL